MVKSEIKNNTAIISLARPDKRNALNPDLVAQLKNALNDAEKNKEVKSVIITGEGSSFCAGADLSYLKEINDNSLLENERDSDSLAELFVKIYKFPKPTIAAVNGPAIAGGCGLASGCDLIVAHPELSKFGYSEVKIGFIPAIVSIFLLRKIGESHTKQMLLTGETISGRRAYEIGFANYLSENVMEESMRVAEVLNNNSSLSIETTKKMIHSVSDMNLDSAIQFCVNLNVISRTTDDFKKGIQKFLNKE
ncbi:MAG: enoyl-CoA hydratase/isomerase family protein [Ignavibacteriaceae bacterium]|nr:enoyl-CoA hydratase/isomerase family protein [Ignavibacteriaceae bacterium]